MAQTTFVFVPIDPNETLTEKDLQSIKRYALADETYDSASQSITLSDDRKSAAVTFDGDLTLEQRAYVRGRLERKLPLKFVKYI